MEEQALHLLKKIVNLRETSLYTLTETLAREKNVSYREIFDETVRLVYLLASNNLVKLEAVEGEDGSETMVKATTLGETYLKSKVAEKVME
jgi:hypothetical protein